MQPRTALETRRELWLQRAAVGAVVTVAAALVGLGVILYGPHRVPERPAPSAVDAPASGSVTPTAINLTK